MNIKEFFGISDPAYPEAEIYRFFKHTTRWKSLVLSVRIHELLYAFPMIIRTPIEILYEFIFREDIYEYQPYIDMVNKWEK